MSQCPEHEKLHKIAEKSQEKRNTNHTKEV